MLARKALAGTAGAPKEYVEDVFSTYLYTGNGSTQTITNDIDLSGEGGLVWIKQRSTASADHGLYDSEKGIDKSLSSNGTSGVNTNISGREITSFNTNGFSLGTNQSLEVNTNAETYASWTFRKAEKFFDIVTYTGNGTTKTVSHNLGSTPGCVIVKSTSVSGTAWYVWHRSLSAGYYVFLNTTAAQSNSNSAISFGNNTTYVDPTSTNFTVGSNGDMNDNGATYVAYLFAHDAGGFGDAGSDSIIKCGSFTTDGSGNATVTLDWEPQWILFKRSNSATGGDWRILDNMRGFGLGTKLTLYPNVANKEATESARLSPSATGFYGDSGGLIANATYIYIAIRRGPMKTPTSGTSVFSPNSSSASTGTKITTDFPIDMQIWGLRADGGSTKRLVDRLRGVSSNTTTSGVALFTDLTDAEDSASASTRYFDNTGFTIPDTFVSGLSTIYWSFRRAPGFFDVVCYTGTGSNINVNHNLGVGPELVIVKRRNSTSDWQVAVKVNSTQYAIGASGDELRLNSSGGASTTYYTYSTYFNSTTFGTGAFWTPPNVNGATYVAYLFASVSGVSKVGSYTGNGSSVTVTTDFQPRFIMVKRTDSTGDWLVSDSARGLVAGNDPYLELNTADAEVTNEDWVDISSTSFTVNQTTNNANVNTGTYIYLAIA